MTMTPPCTVTHGMATLEDLSNLLAIQPDDQERYALAEKIIIDQVTYRDTLIEEIRTLKQELIATQKRAEHASRPDTSNFILQIPGMKENYKRHLDFNAVKEYSDMDATEYNTTRQLKPHEKAELVEKIVKSRERYPVRNYTDMKKTIHSLQQQLLTNSLFACSHILSSEDEGLTLYETWNKGWAKLSETDKDAKNAKLQSSTILEEILRKIFSKDNPALSLQLYHARTKVPEDILGVYALQIIREHFQQATLDVIVRDIIKVLMFSLQAPRCATFDEWHRKFMKSIEDLNLLYGEISWNQIYLAIVMWALELMENKYKLLRQHMKLNLPKSTKALLENPTDTLDHVIKMVTQWDTNQVTSYMKNAMDRKRDMGRDTKTLHIVANLLDIPMAQQDMVKAVAYNTTLETDCSYCKQKNHTLEQCRWKKFDRELKDKVAILVPTLLKNHKALQDLLQQKGRLSNDLENMVKSVLKTFQGLTIGGINMRDRTLQPSRNNHGQTPKQGGKKPFNKTPQTTPRVNDRGGQNGKMPGRDKQKDVSFKNPFDDKKGTPRANMVSEKEHIQAAKRFAGFHSKKSGTFNLYQAGDDQEMRDEEDTGYHSFFMQCEPPCQEDHIKMDTMSKETRDGEENSIKNYDVEQDAELTQDSARILAMTEDELDQAHDIFMLTVDNGQNDMRPMQELTPEEILAWTPEELEEFQQMFLNENTELANIPAMTADVSTNENMENANNLSWEDADLDEAQQQPVTCIWENSESNVIWPDDSPTSYEVLDEKFMHEMEGHSDDMATWDQKTLAMQIEPKLHIVMMDLGDEEKDSYQKGGGYGPLKQFQDISEMLGETAICKILGPEEYEDEYGFRQKLEESLMHGNPTILQINAESHNANGILIKNMRWQPGYMAANIEAATKNFRNSLKAIILNLPNARYLAYELKTMDSIPIYCLHADGYPAMAVSQHELTHRLYGFYMMASLDMNDMNHTMRQSDLSTHMQTLYNLARYFRDKVTSEIELEPDQEEYIQVIKKECKNIIAILEQDTSALDLKQLMEIYIPRSLGIVDEDIPYLDWMETLIRDLLTAKPMWWPIYKQQTSGQILATTYSGSTLTPTNEEIHNIIDLSMNMDSMDKVTRPYANTKIHTKQCFAELDASKKLVVHISCTAEDQSLDFTKNKMEEKNLFDFIYNMCSPEANKKPKKIELMWISANNCTSLARRLTKPQSKMWNVNWVIFASGYIPTEEWESLAQTFYAYYYSDEKRDVRKAYQSTLALKISENVMKHLQLFGKNMDNEIVPARLRLAEMTTKKLAKTQKEEITSAVNDRLMSVHNKVPELNDSDWSKQSKKELCEALIDGMITEEDFTNEVDNLDKPISGNGKTTNTKCVAQIGNYMVIDSELDGDCLYGAVILSNDTMIMGKPLEEELPERAQELRMRMVEYLQDLYENRHNLKMGTLLQKILAVMTQDDIDNYKSHATGDKPPPAGVLDICVLADLMLSDIELHRPTVMRATLTNYLDTGTGAQRKIKILLHDNHYFLLREIDRYSDPKQTMEIPHLISYLNEEEITPTQTLCAGGTNEFRSKLQQSLTSWKNMATMSSFRPTSLLNIVPVGDEEQLRAQHQDILKKISMLQTMVRLATSEHDRETTKAQVQNLKKSEASISQDLRRITSEKQAAQSEKEQDSGMQRKDKPPDRSISPDLIFESIDVMTGHNTISPGHINMLSQTHPTLDRRLSGRPQAIKKEVADGYYSPELAPSPVIIMTVDGIADDPRHPDATPSEKSEIKEIDDTICNFPSCDKPKWTPYDFCGNTHAMMAGAKPIDNNHRNKGIQQTHTWDSMTKTCTPIIHSHSITECDEEGEIVDEDEEEKGTSDDEPESETLARVKRIPRRSLFMEEMTIQLPKPHTTPEKITIVPEMHGDNLESCMTKTQELIQDTINDLFSTTEKLMKMKSSIKFTEHNDLDSKTPRSVLELNYKFLEMRFNEALTHNAELLNTVHELLEEQDNLRNEQPLSNNASELVQQLNLMRAECDKLQKANTQMKYDIMTHEQDTNKQMDLLMRQGVSLQRVIIDLEEETETLKEELRTLTASSTIKKHTEYLVEKQDAQLYKMLHEVLRVLHRKRSTWTLTTPGDMPEMCKRQYHRLRSDLLDEHDKWFRNLELDKGPEKYLEWYNAWMDTRHGLYVMYVAGMTTRTHLISQKLGLYQLPAPLEEWHTSKGKTIPPWRSLFLFTVRTKEKLLSLQTRDKLIMGDMYSLSCGLAMFHMMKTTYIYYGAEHRKSWKVDFTIYSIDKDASDNDTSRSTSRMKVRAHIYPDHSTQVNFSSHEYQTLRATDNTPVAQATPKPMAWTTPPIFTNTRLSEELTSPTPKKMNQSSATSAWNHENRMGTASTEKSPASTTQKSDVKREVLSTPRRSARGQHRQSITPAASTTEIDTATPALAALGKMVIEHLQSSGGAISQIQNPRGAVQSFTGAVQSFTGAVQNSMGAVQNSTGTVQNSMEKKPKRNTRNKNKATPPEPRRFGTRQRKSVERLDK